MTQTRPYNATLDIERRWQQRPNGATLPVDKSRRRRTLSSLHRPGVWRPIVAAKGSFTLTGYATAAVTNSLRETLRYESRRRGR